MRLFRRSMRVVSSRVSSRSAVEGLSNIAGLVVLGAGTLLALDGSWGLSPGSLAAFVTVMLTTQRTSKDLTKSWTQLQDALERRHWRRQRAPVGCLERGIGSRGARLPDAPPASERQQRSETGRDHQCRFGLGDFDRERVQTPGRDRARRAGGSVHRGRRRRLPEFVPSAPSALALSPELT
jgi:ABC-type multidrug transport system fused ATPase/permease subunit